MAEGAEDDEREEELTSIKAIYPDELIRDPLHPFSATINILVAPVTPLPVVFPTPVDGAPPTTLPPSPTSQLGAHPTVQPKSDVHDLSYLPSIQLQVTLPDGYPYAAAPKFRLSTSPPWLPENILKELQKEGVDMWEEYGHEQVLFSYITQLQDAADRGFDLGGTHGDALDVSLDMKIALLDFDIKTKKQVFEQGTYDCEICLEPKKGSSCFQLPRCSHVFCVQCLQDFYNNCISEGDVNGVKCLAPGCGQEKEIPGVKRKKKADRLLTPSELLQIPLETATVHRYVEMKRKKKLESDKTTIYCPRTWCQGAARSKKYPKVTDLSQITESDDEVTDEDTTVSAMPEKGSKAKGMPEADRLAICEDCNYAFCRVCMQGWHGEFVRCWPRDASELTQEERASMNYILAHTSPCPTCSVPCQKSHGCNHMSCFQCKTHFCYLCSSWLDASNPYQHFNEEGKPCYQRLWELEEGDDGTGQVNFNGVRGAEAAAQRAAQAAMNLQIQEIDAAEHEQPQGQPHPPIDVVINGVDQLQVEDDEIRPPAPEPPAPFAPGVVHPNGRHADNQAPREGRRALHMDVLERAGNGPAERDVLREANQMGLQRFLQMVRDDEEDEWDSDELDEADDDFAIPER